MKFKYKVLIVVCKVTLTLLERRNFWKILGHEILLKKILPLVFTK